MVPSFLKMGRNRKFFSLSNVLKFTKCILAYDPTWSSWQLLELCRTGLVPPLYRCISQETESEWKSPEATQPVGVESWRGLGFSPYLLNNILQALTWLLGPGLRFLYANHPAALTDLFIKELTWSYNKYQIQRATATRNVCLGSSQGFRLQSHKEVDGRLVDILWGGAIESEVESGLGN